MKKTIFVLTGLLVALVVSASTYEFKFNGVKLSEALNQIIEQHPELNINFIYNELDNYIVNANIFSDDPYQALRQVVGLNPVAVSHKGNRFYIEALQHGKFAYYGTILADDNEPLPGAAVMILSPRDSSVITYGTSDARGRFNIPCDHRDVIAKFSCMGFLPHYIRSSDFNLGIIRMKDSPVVLKGLKVEADLVSHANDRSIYLPTTRQKNAASDAIDLLRRMAINRLIINPVDNSVTTNNGQSVAIYINRQPASAEDITGLRTADVRRVEFLEYPSEAVYKGVPYAVNFIVQEYVYGGYTKISDAFYFLQDVTNKPSLYSKFTYRKMTYDFYIGVDQVSSKHVFSNQESEFHLADEVVTRNLTNENSKFKYIQFPITFRAFYNTDKVKISNTLGYTFHDRYQSNRSGSLSISPNNGADYQFSSIAPFVNRSFFWNGGYDLYLPHDWNVYIEPRATYGRNSSYSFYSTNVPDQHPIQNDAKENVLNTRMKIDAVKTFAEKHNVSAIFDGGYTNNRIHYYGNSDYHSKFDHSFYAISARYSSKFGKFYLNTDGGFIQEFTRTNVTDFTEPYPFLHIQASFAPNQKSSFSLWFQYAANSPETEGLSPNVIQSNEFLYITGNPDLRPSHHTTIYLNYGWSPNNKFSLNTFAEYYIDHNRIINIYEPYANGNAILRSYINNGDFKHTDLGLNATCRLLDNSLIFQGVAEVNTYKSSGIYNFCKVRPGASIYAGYYTGKFNFSAYYRTRLKVLSSYLPEEGVTRSYYSISAGWANSDWSVSVSLQNFARNKFNYGWSCSTTPLFSNRTYGFNGNYRRAVSITLTYTFGYGKKVNRGNEVGSQGTSSSAILQ